MITHTLWIPIVAFLAGLLIGSFLNVCIYRLPRDLSVASPARSFCPDCAEGRFDALDKESVAQSSSFENPEVRDRVFRESTIVWYDNIPVVSYLLLRGRCRKCKARISPRYPIVELATGAAFAICAGTLGLSLPALKYALFSAILITLIASDFEERILPDEFTLGGTLIGLILAPFVPLEHYFASMFIPVTLSERWHSLAESAFGALMASGSIWLVGYLYEKFRHREGLGLGDVKMIAMIGAFLGLRLALTSLILASLVGAVGGLIYVFATRKDTATYELPFGSFIGLAALFVAIYGQVISVWYSGLGS